MDATELQKLSKVEKFKLMELLWDDLFGNGKSELTSDEKRLLEDRSAYMKKNPENLKGVDDVFNAILKKI